MITITDRQLSNIRYVLVVLRRRYEGYTKKQKERILAPIRDLLEELFDRAAGLQLSFDEAHPFGTEITVINTTELTLVEQTDLKQKIAELETELRNMTAYARRAARQLGWPIVYDARYADEVEPQTAVTPYGKKVMQSLDPEAADWRAVDDGAFARPFGTVRQCVGCGVLIAGGPTRCTACAVDTEPTTLLSGDCARCGATAGQQCSHACPGFVGKI